MGIGIGGGPAAASGGGMGEGVVGVEVPPRLRSALVEGDMHFYEREKDLKTSQHTYSAAAHVRTHCATR